MTNCDFFQNKECAYFPCHQGADPSCFNCMFCYCPLYALGDKCGGEFTYTEKGIKDCSGCLRPHKRENYSAIQKQLTQVLEMVRKQHRQERS